MVKAVCEYSHEKVNKMMKPLKTKAYVSAGLFSVLFIAMGIVSILGSFGDEINWITLVMGIIVTVASVYPPISTYRNQRKNYKDTINAMQLENGDLYLEMTFKDKKLEVITTQGETVQSETILLRNVTQVKTNKNGVGIYIGEDMYYIYNEDIVFGTKDELLRIFQRLNVKIK